MNNLGRSQDAYDRFSAAVEVPLVVLAVVWLPVLVIPLVSRLPAGVAGTFGVIDYLARARLGGEEGWGMFEHASLGRHDPTGFADWSSVAG